MACTSCENRKKKRDDKQKKALINRLNRIEGQIRGIKGMIENDAYCPQVLTQSSAAIAAINAFNKELLSCHIKECVIEDIKDGKEETVDELLSLLQKFMR